jgi:hypothetical protein
MSIYTEELVKELESLVEHTNLLLKKFDAGTKPSDLLNDAKILENRLVNADRLMPEGTTIDWVRKLSFLDYYLRRGEPDNCRGDIVELADYILPSLSVNLCAGHNQRQGGVLCRVEPRSWTAP